MKKAISPKFVVATLTAVLLLAAAVSASTLKSDTTYSGHEAAKVDKQYCTSCHTDAQTLKAMKDKRGF